MSKKKKVSLILIAVFVLMVASFSVISYSIANLQSNKTNSSENIDSKINQLCANLDNLEYVSNIDLIIENSYEDENSTFNIVEIFPISMSEDEKTNSGLKKYINSNGFKDYVIDANREDTVNGKKMNAGKIDYKAITVGPNTELTEEVSFGTDNLTVQSVLDSADLIYLASPSYDSYTVANNMSEPVYNWLHTYALAKDNQKPIILDYVTKSTTSSSVANKTYQTFANAVAKNYIRYRTFGWTMSMDIDSFLSGNGSSYFITYNTNQRTPTGNILVIRNGDSKEAMQTALENYGETSIIQNAYYGRKRPSKINIDAKKASELTTTDLDVNSLKYDFVFIEDGVKGTVLSDEMYEALVRVSESSNYIIYNQSWITVNESQGSSTTMSNYHKLMSLLVSDKGVAMYANVLPVTNSFFGNLNDAGENGLASAKLVANLINYSVYRGHGGGSDSKKFRVLEIEPCYPIDLEVARNNKTTTTSYVSQSGIKGGYYTYPDQVLYGVTKEEVAEGVEYYAFELSKAKIAHATGLKYGQIHIDYMSTDEYISSKEVTLESYDLVYIGGDSSAIANWNEVAYVSNWTYDQAQILWAKNSLTYFDMYTHTGFCYDLDSSFAGQVVNGQTKVETNGNDLTTIKRDELEAYIDAGLPIIIDKSVSDAFEDSYQYDPDNKKASNKNRMKQLALKEIDPDSNMYQFLEYAYSNLKDKTNISWGSINVTDAAATQVVDNSERAFGNTLGSSVTVYSEANETVIRNLINASSTRPRLSVTTAPVEYSEGDTTTYNTGATATFSGTVTPTNSLVTDYVVSLFVDINGDNSFSEAEKIATTNCSSDSNTFSLTYDIDDDFMGIVSWKVVAQEADGVTCDTASGFSYYKRQDDLKKTIRILQIMPIERSNQGSTNDRHSLYFCTECQASMRMLNNNITAGGDSEKTVGYNAKKSDSETVFSGNLPVKVGKHEHDFGIVKFDTNLGDIGNDDWESNFADTLTHGADGTLDTGEYDFDLEIVTHSEFDAMCAAAETQTEDEAAGNLINASNKKDEISSLLADPTFLSYKDTLEDEMYKAVDIIKNENKCPSAYFKAIKEGIGTPDKPGQWMLDEQYYKIWEYYNSDAANGSNDSIISGLVNAYNNYIEKYDEIVEAKEQYKEYMHASGTAEKWLSKNYDMVVLGFAENFGNQDLTQEACTQLKSYITAGGAVLNTHDTMTKYQSTGAINLTNSLRDVFGMDRFHVTGTSSDSSVTVYAPTLGSSTIKFSEGNQWGNATREITYSNKDITIQCGTNSWEHFSAATITEGTEHTNLSDKIKVTITGVTANSEVYYPDPKNSSNYIHKQADASGNVTIELPQPTQDITGGFKLGESNLLVNFNTTSGEVTTTADSSALSADGKIKVSVSVTDGTSILPDGVEIKLNFRSTNMSAIINDGVAVFNIDPSIADVDLMYKKYATEDSSKYFWTERAVVPNSTTSAYATWLQNSQVKIGYNSPIGVTDYFVLQNSGSSPTSPYLYAMMLWERIAGNPDTDGYNFDAKYGARRASQVNKGCVTMFPFTISSELLISGTHSSYYALDLEDENVCVWYTIGGTSTAENLDVNANAARLLSSVFAASPRDGMDNYFLYSKGNVFYCGAGHALVTARGKDNNDERRLFINIIVNSVSKAKSLPKIKLYNRCDETGSSHDNCDHQLVEKDSKDNEAFSKVSHKLFYNSTAKIYQYNVDEQDDCPEFDFKVFKGTADISEIKVFYDLNYGKGDGMDASNMYTADDNHVLIASYSKVDQKSNKRIRLREADFKNLKLKKKYFDKYQNFTYMVIYVKDEDGNAKYERIKINLIPHLFDLTDATFDSQSQPVASISFMLDMTDKNKFNI